jgi:hypothetical protein
MPTDSKKDRPSQKGSKKDDFRVIKGIGEALDEWLRESFNVHTYAELAKLSARELRSRAFHDDVGLTSSKIKEILDEAKKLADASQSPAPESGQPVSPPAPKTAQPVSSQAEEGPVARPEKENDWKEFASFMVYFERKVVGGREEKRTTIERRTAIHHMETADQESWPGIVADHACQWMLERLGEKEKVGAKEEAPSAETPKPSRRIASDRIVTKEEEAPIEETLSTAKVPVTGPMALDITGIQVFQPPSSGQPQDLFAESRTFNGFVKGGAPLSFAATFQLTGLGASDATKSQKEFRVIFNGENIFTSAVTRIGVSKPDFLKEGQLSYTTLLSPFTLSPGVYRLEIIVTVQDVLPLWASIGVPLLQVA